jgi:hypothetical protein
MLVALKFVQTTYKSGDYLTALDRSHRRPALAGISAIKSTTRRAVANGVNTCTAAPLGLCLQPRRRSALAPLDAITGARHLDDAGAHKTEPGVVEEGGGGLE